MRKGLWETRPHRWPSAGSLCVLVYKIQKYIANLNNFVVGRTCRWLFDDDTLYSRAKQLDAIQWFAVYQRTFRGGTFDFWWGEGCANPPKNIEHFILFRFAQPNRKHFYYKKRRQEIQQIVEGAASNNRVYYKNLRHAKYKLQTIGKNSLA